MKSFSDQEIERENLRRDINSLPPDELAAVRLWASYDTMNDMLKEADKALEVGDIDRFFIISDIMNREKRVIDGFKMLNVDPYEATLKSKEYLRNFLVTEVRDKQR